MSFSLNLIQTKQLSGKNLPVVSRSMGFPGGASDKESTYYCRRHKRNGSDPWVRKMPRGRKWLPTPVILPGQFHGQRSLRATVRGTRLST